jgi:VRR-NUC domain.
MRESKVESHLIKQVKLHGGETRKCQWLGRRGAPDRYVLWPKRADWVELKKPKTPHAEDHQKREHVRLRAAGQLVFLLTSIAEVDQYIEWRSVENG